MKNILLLVHQDDGQEARLQAALDVTRAVGGHLICLDVFVPPIVYGDLYGSGGAAIILEEDSQQIAAQHREAMTERLAHEDVSWTWHEVRGGLAQELTEASELADLIVVSSHFEGVDQRDSRRVAADVIMKSGRPVLAVPNISKGLTVTGPVMIAWDGSRPAGNALKAAVPLLKLASTVTVFEVGEPDEGYPAADAAAYLSRHEIHARILAEDDTDIAGAITERAQRANVSYIVMGAFGHSRVVESLLGGVTRTMLAECDIPLLLCH
jgi:nucleotide-binding universal stress UspA family protein